MKIDYINNPYILINIDTESIVMKRKRNYNEIMAEELKLFYLQSWRDFEKMLTDPLFVLVEVFSHGTPEDCYAQQILIDLLKRSHPPQCQISYMEEVD